MFDMFDEYRKGYDAYSDDEHRRFYTDFHLKWPLQRCCTFSSLRRFLGDHRKALVIEMGGWDGWAASTMLPEFPELQHWLNVEFCKEAAAATVCDDARYNVYVPKAFRWWRSEVAPTASDVMVLSHVIEHIANDDARELIGSLRPLAWYIEAPLTEDGQTWSGYGGSHVLYTGWRELETWLSAAGYRRVWAEGDARSYSRAR